MQIFILNSHPTETKSDIISVDVSQMKFTRSFYRSDDFLTAIDTVPSNPKLVCCGNYSGRIFIYDFEKKVQIVENRLKLQKRKSSSSDTEIIEIAHVSVISFSPDGHHLLCGLENGSLITLDPNILHELGSLSLTQHPIVGIKFSPDSTFVTIFVRNFHMWLQEITCLVHRMTDQPSFSCIMIRLSCKLNGKFSGKFVTIRKPFVMSCTFHHQQQRFMFHPSISLFPD